MQSFKDKTVYSFQSNANALGGFVDKPLQKNIPTVAPVSLPPTGGFATARSGAFNLDEVVSVSSAYTLVTGRQDRQDESDGSISMLSTAVVENLNILEVVTAERIVAQISVIIPHGDGRRRISFAGTRFEGLRLAGRDCIPRMNRALLRPEVGDSAHGLPSLTRAGIEAAARAQADGLESWFEGGHKDARQWAENRHGWMRSSPTPHDVEGHVLCSLVDGLEDLEEDFEGPESDGYSGHIVEIPGFGRIILGELFVSRDSVQLVSIRAELGCPIGGMVNGPAPCASGGGGQGNKD